MASRLYQPLNVDLKEIRLLELLPGGDISKTPRCRLKTASLLAKPKFEALSYCWGDPNVTRDIAIEDLSRPVTVSLDAALRHLRGRWTRRTLWADAICINQNDPEERGQQVRLMRDIYSSATCVRVWLGDSNERTKDAFEWLTTLYGFIKLRSKKPLLERISVMDEPILDHISDLLSYPWWRRIWIVQELLLAQSAMVHCGRFNRAFRIISDTYTALHKELSVDVLNSNRSSISGQQQIARYLFNLRETVGLQDAIYGVVNRSNQAEANRKIAVPLVLNLARGYGASDDRDKVYGVIGLLSSIIDIKPDYKSSTESVYTDTAFQIMNQTKSLSLLGTVSRRTPGLDLPTWAPNWKEPTGYNGLQYSSHCGHLFNACAGEPHSLQRPQFQKLELKAHLNGHIISTGQLNSRLGYYGGEVAPLQQMGTFITQSLDFLRSHYKDTQGTLHDLELHKALARLLCFDCLPVPKAGSKDAYEYRRCLPSDIARLDKFCQSLLPSSKSASPAQDVGVTILLSHLQGHLGERRLFKSSSGQLGTGPQTVETGDVIVALAGHPVPVLLRAAPTQGGNTYTVVGECYVQGIMDGEAVLAARERVTQTGTTNRSSQGASTALGGVFQDIFVV